ncbi:calmin isoform X2 [Elgaria multicarinata webbii]|uniref:calmin isoform X2 n=1 Tax=Elgaria multicarinata webbii TaxID=159646 RepID=UPI002FCCECF2
MVVEQEVKQVKLVSIDAAEIADGNSSMVLGLIWNIILFFQIKELTGNLNRNSSSSSLSSGPSGPDSDTSHPSTPNVERSMSVSVKDQRKTIKALLTWVQRKTRKYGVAVQDFASSWRSGLAFLAIIKAIDSNLVDMKQALEKSSRDNLEDAFGIAQDHLGIARLLEPEDIMVDSPDEQSIMTYVAQFLEHFPELEGEDFSDPDKEFPVESTHVHLRESPEEEKQGKVLILNENGENTYMSQLDRSQSPPHKIHMHGSPLDHFHMAGEDLNAEEPQSPCSLPITEPIGFQSCSVTDILANNVNRSEGTQESMGDSSKQNDDHPPTVLMYRTHSVDMTESEEFTVQKPTNETKGSLDRKTCSLSWTSHPPKTVPEHLSKKLEYPMSESQEEDSVQKHVLHMLHEEISNLPEKCEYAKEGSDVKEMHVAHQEIDGPNFKDNSEASGPSERWPIRNTPKSLDITNEDGSMAMMASNSSKVSVIPHDLFYYPHYDVPISAVLDAFATPEADPSLSENNKICTELLENCLAENELLSQNIEEDIPKPGRRISTNVASTEMDGKVLEKQKKYTHIHSKSSLNKAAVAGKNVVPKSNSNATSPQQDSAHPDVPVIVVNQFDPAAEERKLPEERSKRKEKRKNKAIFQGENAQSPKPGSTRLLDKLEEEFTDYQGLSRVSHSDPNVVSQRYSPDSTSKQSGSTDVQNSMATSEITSPSVRKRKDPEKKEDPEKADPTPATTSQTDQPELFYFIVFLWVLVYCLLLLPQLTSSPL